MAPADGVEVLPGLEPRVREQHFAPTVSPTRPDVAADAFSIPGATLRAASVRGISHRYYGDPRQDSYAVAVSDDRRWIIVAVADGLSSAPRSHRGSALAARRAVSSCLAAAQEPDAGSFPWRKLFMRIADEVMQESQRLAASSKGDHAPAPPAPETLAAAIATTLTVVAVPLTQDGPRAGVIAAVGDSGVWKLRGRWQPLTQIKDSPGELSSSSVHPLPWLGEDEPAVTAFTVEPGDLVVAMSDGIGDLLGEGETSAAAFFAQRWHEPPSTAQFIAEVDLRVQSFDDDRTAVAIWLDHQTGGDGSALGGAARRPAAAGLPPPPPHAAPSDVVGAGATGQSPTPSGHTRPDPGSLDTTPPGAVGPGAGISAPGVTGEPGLAGRGDPAGRVDTSRTADG